MRLPRPLRAAGGPGARGALTMFAYAVAVRGRSAMISVDCQFLFIFLQPQLQVTGVVM